MTLSTSSRCDKTDPNSRFTETEKAEIIAKILNSEAFERANRSKQLLEFLANWKSTEGKPCTQYDIALHVFGRTSNFDAEIDSLVRVQMSRLRVTLKKYYETEGADESILVTLPKGSYKLNFLPPKEHLDRPNNSLKLGKPPNVIEKIRDRYPQTSHLLRAHRYNLIFVLSLLIVIATLGWQVPRKEGGSWLPSFSGLSDSNSDNDKRAIILEKCRHDNPKSEPQEENIPNIIAAGLIDRLKRSKIIEIYTNRETDKELVYPVNNFCFILVVETVEADKLLSFRLVRRQTGRLVWVKNLWVSDQQVSADTGEIINNIAAKLQAKLYALSANVMSSEKRKKTPEELFLMSTWIPGHTENKMQWHLDRIQLAKQALEIDPDFGPAHSVLADKIAYLSSFYEYRDLALERKEADEHAHRALELSPDDPDAILNVANYYFHSGDMPQHIFYVERALELAPHHPIARITRHQISCRTPSKEIIADMVALDKQLDPGDLLRWLTLQTLGELYLDRGEFDKAVSVSAKSHAIFRSPIASIRYAALLAVTGNNAKAKQVIERNARNWPKINLEKYVGETISARCRGGDEQARTNQYKTYSALLTLTGTKNVLLPSVN